MYINTHSLLLNTKPLYSATEVIFFIQYIYVFLIIIMGVSNNRDAEYIEAVYKKLIKKISLVERYLDILKQRAAKLKNMWINKLLD